MKKLLFFLIILTIYGCNKPKTVLICGDHVCINKGEAKQYFEDHLTLEVKIVDKKKSKEINLVEINLKSNPEGKKEISILNKKQTNKKLKVLSNIEIKKKKAELKERKKIKNKEKKEKEVKDVKATKQAKLEESRDRQKPKDNIIKAKKIVNKPGKKITDICTILEKCSIDEISKYLVKQGKEKKTPDITIRENK